MVSRKGINRFKAFFWWVELITFPMLANILGAGTCNYYTDEKSIKVVNCFDKSIGYGLPTMPMSRLLKHVCTPWLSPLQE
jgi:hypothetical protein